MHAGAARWTQPCATCHGARIMAAVTGILPRKTSGQPLAGLLSKIRKGRFVSNGTEW